MVWKVDSPFSPHWIAFLACIPRARYAIAMEIEKIHIELHKRRISMLTLGSFFLVVAAFIGTVMFFINPFTRLQKQFKGKKTSEVRAELKQKLEDEPGEMVAKGLGCCLFAILGMSYTFIIEPLAIIAALINKIGYQPLAYAMLFIVAVSWIQFAMTIMRNGNKPKVSGTVKTHEGKEITGDVVSLDEEVNFGNPVWNATKRLFFFLPDLYLWYIFLVVIGVMS